MEVYISDRKDVTGKEETKDKHEHADHMEEQKDNEEQVAPKEQKRSFASKIMGFITGDDDEETMDDESEILEEAKDSADPKNEDEHKKAETEERHVKKEKKSIISTVKGWLSFSEEEEDSETSNELDSNDKKPDAPLVADDLKEVLKIQNRWMMRLPNRILQDFKESQDYVIYKETLKKYNLVKKKEE
jgi:hypothetical protein